MSDAGAFDPEAILRTLEENGVAYVLIGGLAASLHGSPHVTTDAHIAPSREPTNLRLHAIEITIHGTRVVIAALADVIRSKEAANREKDRLTLPALRRLLARLEGRE